MAFRAHVIPILGDTRPVEDVARQNTLLIVDMKPTLSALLLGTGVPAERQALVSPARKLDKILLQGPYAKSVFDLIVLKFAIRAFCMDIILTGNFVEVGGDTQMIEGHIVEIAEHGSFCGHIHGHVMVGADIKIVLFFMAVLARLTPDIFKSCRKPFC